MKPFLMAFFLSLPLEEDKLRITQSLQKKDKGFMYLGKFPSIYTQRV